MDFFVAVRNRRSIRAYEMRPVEPEKLRAILEAAAWAPSAGNLQAYEIVRVDTAQGRRRLAAAAHDQTFVAEAPVVLVFSALPKRSEPRYGRRGAELYCVQDATIACAYAQLAATALGLASTWVGAFDEDAVRGVVRASSDVLPVAILPIAYAAEEGEATTRRDLSELVRHAP